MDYVSLIQQSVRLKDLIELKRRMSRAEQERFGHLLKGRETYIRFRDLLTSAFSPEDVTKRFTKEELLNLQAHLEEVLGSELPHVWKPRLANAISHAETHSRT